MRTGRAAQAAIGALGVASILVACGGSAPPPVVAKRSPFRRPTTSQTKKKTPAPPSTAIPVGPAPSPKTVIVMPPTAGPFVLLFPDELEALRQKLVAELSSADGSDYVPYPEDRMRALTDRVKAGKLLEGGAVCAKPPTLAEVVDAETKGGLDDGLSVASIMLDCDAKDEDCMLQVSIGGLEGEREAELMLSTKVTGASPRTNVDAWTSAVENLAQVDELVGNGYGFGSGRGSELVRASLRETSGDFGPGFAESPALPPSPALAACHDASPQRKSVAEYDAILSVTPAGKVDKCALELEADAKRESCLCGAFQKTKFPASSSPVDPSKKSRRVLYAVQDQPSPRKRARAAITARVNVLEGAGHPEAAQLLDIRALDDCFLATSPKDDITFDMHLTVDPAGHVTKADIGTVPAGMKSCLARAYLATPLGCDMEGETRVLHVGVTLSLPGAVALRSTKESDTDLPKKTPSYK